MPLRHALVLVVFAGCAGDDIPPPRIASIVPDHGVPGTVVTIDGDHFCQQPEPDGEPDPLACDVVGTAVFGTTNAASVQYRDLEILAEVPALPAGSVRVTIQVGVRISNGFDFQIE